jgi:hypothetical protein
MLSKRVTLATQTALTPLCQLAEMTRGKSAKLQAKSARLRTIPRERVVIEGQCVIGERGKEEALVTDLALTGCRVRTEAVGVTRSEALVLWLGEVGPIPGKLKWTKGGSLGVKFDYPLEQGMLEALLAAGEPISNVIPLRA